MLGTVILVDDDENLRYSIKRSLRAQSYHLLAVESAQSCIDLLAATEAQIIISDLNMPGHSGTVLIEYLKSNRPDIVRIVMSGNLDLETTLSLINKGEVFRCLRKPCPATELATTIQDAFKYYKKCHFSKKHQNVAKSTAKHDAQQHLVVDDLLQPDLTSLIRSAVDEVEKLDRALLQNCGVERQIIKN